MNEAKIDAIIARLDAGAPTKAKIDAIIARLDAGAPTKAQVDAAERRYQSFDLKIENFKARKGYVRSSYGGGLGELQRKKGAAYTEWQNLKRAYEASVNKNG